MTVRLLSQYTGRGPTKARTFFNDDMVTVVLQDTLTKGERTLVDNDRDNLVLRTRLTFQQVMRGDLIAGIEEITGRSVIAFLSANHIDPDIAVETFVLAPSAQTLSDPAHTQHADGRFRRSSGVTISRQGEERPRRRIGQWQEGAGEIAVEGTVGGGAIDALRRVFVMTAAA